MHTGVHTTATNYSRADVRVMSVAMLLLTSDASYLWQFLLVPQMYVVRQWLHWNVSRGVICMLGFLIVGYTYHIQQQARGCCKRHANVYAPHVHPLGTAGT